jgi:hypothetical protein
MESENPLLPLSFIAGPAILTNACAIMQNSATMRYQLAISQWREFRAAIAIGDGALAALYSDPDRALELGAFRIKLLLWGLNALYSGVAFFGATTFLGLVGAFGSSVSPILATGLLAAMIAAAGLGLAALLVAVFCFTRESRCAHLLLKLQLELDP